MIPTIEAPLFVRIAFATPCLLPRPHARRSTVHARTQRRSPRTAPVRRAPAAQLSGGGGGGGGVGGGGGEESAFSEALEQLLVEALRTYYEGTPPFSDAEFNTLREELEHLGLAQVRLYDMEKLWVQATSSRDLDRRIRKEFDLSEADLDSLKSRLMLASKRLKDSSSKPSASASARHGRLDESQYPHDPHDLHDPHDPHDPQSTSLPQGEEFLCDAQKINAGEQVNERIKWLLFTDATEERLKIMLLYLPAVVMSFATASFFTFLFALLDGEMQITISSAGRFRLGILSYVVVGLTFWFSNQVTPVMLDYLDLGQPSLMRGACPICGSSVSCLFTGATRNRDERNCSVCGATVGFNKKWSKMYLVSSPRHKSVQQPD